MCRAARTGSPINDLGALLSTGGPSGETNFGCNEDGNLTTRADAAGTAIHGYTNGRRSTIQDGLTGIIQTLSYDNADQLSDVDYGDGRMRELTYDNFGRLARDELNVGPTTAAARSVPTVNDRLTVKETSWTHDPTADPGPTTVAYGWDETSNCIAVDDRTADFDERNRLIRDGTHTYDYTPRGTQTSARGQSLAFDAFDWLITQGRGQLLI